MIDPIGPLGISVNQPFQDNETPVKILKSEAQVIFSDWPYFMRLVKHDC